FAINLIQQALYQSGLNYSPNSFVSFIPNDRFVIEADKQLKNFSNLPEVAQKDLLKSFEEQMYRNNWGNIDMIPRRKSVSKKDLIPTELTGTDPYKGGLSPREVNHDFISIRYYRDSKEAQTIARANDQFPPVVTVLYRKTEDSTPSMPKFRIVKTLGDGIRFKEYYPISYGDVLRDDFQSLIPETQSRLDGPQIETTTPTDMEPIDDWGKSTPTEEGSTEGLFGLRTWKEYERERFGYEAQNKNATQKVIKEL
ncbi:unnamed protein product, partial [marine sediment metagenome]